MTDLRKAAEMALEWMNKEGERQFASGGWAAVNEMNEIMRGLRQALAHDEQVSGDTSDGYHTFNELYDFRKAYNAALFNEWAASGKYSVHKSKRHYDGKECFGGGWFIVVAQLPNGQISNHYEMKDWDKFQLPEADKALFEYDNHTGADVLHRLFSLQPFAQPDNTSDSATRSADSAESFCKQELHNLMSVAGRMALELECLLLDTKDLSVVSKWWDTGMEALQAYRHYVWSVTHGKDGENFCDTHCVHTDHHPDCELAQPEQEPVAWLYDWKDGVEIIKDWITSDFETTKFNCAHNIRPLYATPISEPVKERISEPVENLEPVAWRWLYNGKPDSDKCFDGKGPDADVVLRAANAKFPRTVQYFYTAPPKREWQGLTDDEIDTAWRVADYTESYGKFRITVARAIEAKLKEKNT